MSEEIFLAHFIYTPLSLDTKYQSFIYGKFILQKDSIYYNSKNTNNHKTR